MVAHVNVAVDVVVVDVDGDDDCVVIATATDVPNIVHIVIVDVDSVLLVIF